MPGEHLLTELATITIRTPTGARDAYGAVLVAEDTRTAPCWHYQTARDETQPVAEQTWEAWFPPGDPLSATDKVTIDSIDFEVVGPPSGRQTNPRTGELDLVRATLRRTDG